MAAKRKRAIVPLVKPPPKGKAKGGADGEEGTGVPKKKQGNPKNNPLGAVGGGFQTLNGSGGTGKPPPGKSKPGGAGLGNRWNQSGTRPVPVEKGAKKFAKAAPTAELTQSKNMRLKADGGTNAPHTGRKPGRWRGKKRAGKLKKPKEEAAPGPRVVEVDGEKFAISTVRPRPRARTEEKKAAPLSSNWEAMKFKIGAAKQRKHKPAAHTVKGSAAVAGKEWPCDGGGRPLPRSSDASHTRVVALDCEMVGVGPDGARSVLARCCIVNEAGNVLMDKVCRPKEKVIDFRTAVSGVKPGHLRNAPPFDEVHKEAAGLLTGRIVVGHALQNDFRALLLSHPRKDVRDTAAYRPLKREHEAGGKARTQSLKALAAEHLDLRIQEGVHSPVDDARAALFLYLKHRDAWEQSLQGGHAAALGTPAAAPAKAVDAGVPAALADAGVGGAAPEDVTRMEAALGRDVFNDPCADL